MSTESTEPPNLPDILKKVYDLLAPLKESERRRIVQSTFTLLQQELPGPKETKDDEKK